MMKKDGFISKVSGIKMLEKWKRLIYAQSRIKGQKSKEKSEDARH